MAPPMVIGCIDPSHLLKDGAALILGDFVEPLPDEVPIHYLGRLSRNPMPVFYHNCGHRYRISLGGIHRELK
jgi:hypothetical protein